MFKIYAHLNKIRRKMRCARQIHFDVFNVNNYAGNYLYP